MDGLFPNNILEVIGSEKDNASRSSLTVGKTLDLMSWADLLGSNGPMFTMYPHLWASIMEAYFSSRPDLTNGKKYNFYHSEEGKKFAFDSVKTFKELLSGEFLSRVQIQANDFFENIYRSKHEMYKGQDGQKIVSSLCEDVFTYISITLKTIQSHDIVHSSPSQMMDAISILFVELKNKQSYHRDLFLHDFESTIAAANDFIRVSEKMEESVSQLKLELRTALQKIERNTESAVAPDNTLAMSFRHSFRQSSFDSRTLVERTLDECTSSMLSLYYQDAVFAAQSLHIFILESLEKEILPKLFSSEWEELLTYNNIALSITETIEDYWKDIVEFLDELLLEKCMIAIIQATFHFYVKAIVLKSSKHSSDTIPFFKDETSTIKRIDGDFHVIKGYFEHHASKNEKIFKNISKIIQHEFQVLDAVREILSTAFGSGRPKKLSNGKKNPIKRAEVSEASHYIGFLQTRILDVDITKRLVGDIWHLAAPKKEYKIWTHMKSMKYPESTLPSLNETGILETKKRQPGTLLDLSSMLEDIYKNIKKRSLPLKGQMKHKIKSAVTPSKLTKTSFIPYKKKKKQPNRSDLSRASSMSSVTSDFSTYSTASNVSKISKTVSAPVRTPVPTPNVSTPQSINPTLPAVTPEEKGVCGGDSNNTMKND